MPAKLPTEIKRLRGTFRPCRENVREPKGRSGVPPPSRELNAAVKREFRKLAALLGDMRILTEGDQGELEHLALSRVLVRIIQNKLFGTADMKEFRKAQIALNDQIRLSSSLASKFGLNPSDRSRVSVLPERWAKEEEPFNWNNVKQNRR
ncbi:MAG: P27 family phage terminase small subunit [Thermodesulfobacteriota bacterium]